MRSIACVIPARSYGKSHVQEFIQSQKVCHSRNTDCSISCVHPDVGCRRPVPFFAAGHFRVSLQITILRIAEDRRCQDEGQSQQYDALQYCDLLWRISARFCPFYNRLLRLRGVAHLKALRYQNVSQCSIQWMTGKGYVQVATGIV